MRTIGIVTTSRADFGIYQPILRALMARPDVDARLVVSGAHLDERFGLTVREIEDAGFRVDSRVPVHVRGDRRVDVAEAIGHAVCGFSRCFAESAVDLIVVLGDRYEMFAAAIAAAPLKLPIAHIHGGELTTGAFDDAMRHAMTKLSHLHFTSTDVYAARVRQMGEEPWRVVVSGAPGLDNLASFEPVSATEFNEAVGLQSSAGRPILVTFHPTTLDSAPPADQVRSLLEALATIDAPLLFTAPNADPGRTDILDAIESFARSRRDAVVATSLGTRLYFSAMAHAAAMVGNSSSGIIEAASFRLPVLDIGTRQEGRVKPANVVTVADAADEIRRGLERVLDPAFRASLQGLKNPYFHGGAADIIADRLSSVAIDDRLIVKRFADVPAC